MRTLPNIVITGTPCTGKSSTATHLISITSTSTPNPITLKHLDVNALAKFSNSYASYDARLHTQIVDDDKLLDALTAQISDSEGVDGGGWVIDWHSCDLFPLRWIDLVVVLRCERTDVLFDRMKDRGYADEKVQENLDAEIFGVVAEEAREGFGDEGGCEVVELKSETVEDLESNAERVLEWVQAWVKKREGEDDDD